jgi:uncharacterized membrane protein YgdD (TMEM256/DUF423 family)
VNGPIDGRSAASWGDIAAWKTFLRYVLYHNKVLLALSMGSDRQFWNPAGGGRIVPGVFWNMRSNS